MRVRGEDGEGFQIKGGVEKREPERDLLFFHSRPCGLRPLLTKIKIGQSQRLFTFANLLVKTK